VKSINTTVPPAPIPFGTEKQVKDGYAAFKQRRQQQPGWRFMSPFRNHRRMEEERKKLEGTK
jgi:hypothetical protein